MTRAALLAVLVAVAGCEDPPPPDDAFIEPDTTSISDTTSMIAEPMTGGARYPGELAAGDSTLASGEFADEVRVTARRGQRIVVDMVSTTDMDTYLILRAPDGTQYENDDTGPNTHSRVEVVADTSGTWRAIATSFEAGQTGPYTLRISVE